MDGRDSCGQPNKLQMVNFSVNDTQNAI